MHKRWIDENEIIFDDINHKKTCEEETKNN